MLSKGGEGNRTHLARAVNDFDVVDGGIKAVLLVLAVLQTGTTNPCGTSLLAKKRSSRAKHFCEVGCDAGPK